MSHHCNQSTVSGTVLQDSPAYLLSTTSTSGTAAAFLHHVILGTCSDAYMAAYSSSLTGRSCSAWGAVEFQCISI